MKRNLLGTPTKIRQATLGSYFSPAKPENPAPTKQTESVKQATNPPPVEAQDPAISEELKWIATEITPEMLEMDDFNPNFGDTTATTTSAPPSSASQKSNDKPASPEVQQIKMPSKYEGLDWRQRRKAFNKENALEQAVSRYDFLKDRMDANKRRPDDPDFDPRTLYIPRSSLITMTSFEKQYWSIKQNMMDCVVFFNKGWFYELYELDAEIGRKELGLTVSNELRCNMRYVGFPKSQWRNFASKLLYRGYKIARVDENKSPTLADQKNGSDQSQLVRRELDRIISVGTIVDEELLPDHNANYLVGICESRAENSEFAVCIVDAACAEFQLGHWVDDAERTHLRTMLFRLQPKEILHEKGKLQKLTLHTIRTCCPDATIEPLQADMVWDASTVIDKLTFENYWTNEIHRNSVKSRDQIRQLYWPEVVQQFSNNELVMSALGIVVSYLQRCQLDHDLLSLKNFKLYDPSAGAGVLVLDGRTVQALELFRNEQTQTEDGSLIQLLDRCSTNFGKRLLRRWLSFPLQNVSKINERLDAVEALIRFDREVAIVLKQQLRKIPDLERMLSRAHSGSLSLTDFLRMLDGFDNMLSMLRNASSIVRSIGGPNVLRSTLLYKLFTITEDQSSPFMACMNQLEQVTSSFDREAAKTQNKIQPHPGFDPVYDEAKEAVQKYIKQLNEHLEEQVLFWKSSKVQYVHVKNERYLIEVPAEVAQGRKLPKEYELLPRTNKKVVRFKTSTVKEILPDLQKAELELEHAENQTLSRYLKKFDENYRLWRQLISHVAEIDCLLSLAEVSSNNEYTRPILVESAEPYFFIRDMKHPCLAARSSTEFVSNDVALGGDMGQPRVILLTGPNMGGKSTLLRQVCVAVIMAQMGCFVHASYCQFTPVDRIFTRLGAYDNIFAGQSTFMTELHEAGKVLKLATSNSLVIMDELGRGTSTFDGYAIAYAVLMDLAQRIRCRCLFSTHYHMLTDEFDPTLYPDRSNLVHLAHMSALVGGRKTTDLINNADGLAALSETDVNEDVIFLYKMEPGACPKSYGLNVARMAGVPMDVLTTASTKAMSFIKVEQPNTSRGCNLRVKTQLIGQLFKLLLQLDSAPLEDMSALQAAITKIIR